MGRRGPDWSSKVAIIEELMQAEIAHQERHGPPAATRGVTLEDLKAERARRDRLKAKEQRRGPGAPDAPPSAGQNATRSPD